MSLKSVLSSRSAQTVPRTPPPPPRSNNRQLKSSASFLMENHQPTQSRPTTGTCRAKSAAETLELLESVILNLEKRLDESQQHQKLTQTEVIGLNENLKVFGSAMEENHKEKMDQLMTRLGEGFRKAMKEDKIDKFSKFNFLEIIELRSMDWKPNENVTNYYKQKLSELNPQPATDFPVNNNNLQGSLSLNVNAPGCTPNTKTPLFATSKAINSNLGKQMSGDYSSPGAKFVKSLSFGGKPHDHYKCEVRLGTETLELSGKNEGFVKSARSFLLANFPCENNNFVPKSRQQQQVQVVRQPTVPGQNVSENFSSHERRNLFAKTSLEKQKIVEENSNKSEISRTVSSPSPPSSRTLQQIIDGNNNEKSAAGNQNSKVIRYSRKELLDLAELNPDLLPKNWVSICLEFPDIERKDQDLKNFPYDWDEAFANSNLAVISSALLPTVGHSSYTEKENNNNMNLPSKKKNFLEVLRPDAPIRSWNEELGEWVEISENIRG